jgi:hypothetical protein
MMGQHTPSERLNALLQREGLKRRFNPASARDLAAANAVASLPEPLTALYLAVDEFRFGEVAPFAISDFIEINEVSPEYSEVGEGIFVASDLADGWFFVDPTGFMGLSAGFVYWVERGRFVADDCVPAAESLIDLFEQAAVGATPWKGPMLGDRALDRLLGLLASSKAVAQRPPIDPPLFARPGQVPLPLRLARLLEQANGFLLHISQREFAGIADIAAVQGSGQSEGLAGALWVGHGPGGQRYAMTTGIGWRDLPGERMLGVGAGEGAAQAPVFGRVWDVWSRWIEDDSRK